MRKYNTMTVGKVRTKKLIKEEYITKYRGCEMKNCNLEELILELEIYRHKGAVICLSGKASTPFEVAQAIQVNEQGCYMRDYIADKNGKIKEIHFDKVRE